MARAWVHDRMKDADYPPKVAKAKKEKRQPPMRWQVRWYDPSGTRQTELWRKEKEATDRRDEIAVQLAQGTYRDPKAGRAKVPVVAEEWFTAKSPGWAPKTRRLVRGVIDGYVEPRWSTVAIGAVDYASYATWLAGLHNQPGLQGSGKRVVGASRVQSIHHVMLGIMTWAVRAKRIPENPIRALDTLPTVPKGKRLYLDHVQIMALADAVGQLRTAYANKKPVALREVYAVMVETMAYCGLRMGETIALRAGSVDLAARELHVVEAVREGDDGKPVLGLPKGGRIRVVGIPEFLATRLRTIMPEDAEALVFPSPKGEMLNAYNWRERIFRRAVEDARLPDGTPLPKGVTPHTLRHSFASLAVAGGADVKTLQATMGHASAVMTLDVYSDLFPARVGEVALALGIAREMALAA